MPIADQRLRTVLDGAIPFALPLRRTFRGVDVREGVLIKGPSGWGEFAPFADYSDAAASRWLDSAVESAYGRWPAARRTEVEVNAIIPELDSDDAAVLARTAVSDAGCRTVKIKVGGLLTEDEARVASVRDVLDALLGRGRGAIRIDANGAWDVATAASSLRRLGAYGLEYVEQPCRTDEEMRELRRLTDIPLAVDETVRTAADPLAVRVREFADIAVVKAATLGGVAAALQVVEQLDVPVVISGSLDSSVGLSVGLALAAVVDELPFACGFGTGALFAADLVDDPLLPEGGVLSTDRRPPDLRALLEARDRMPNDRAQWWRARLADAWNAGTGVRLGGLVGA